MSQIDTIILDSRNRASGTTSNFTIRVPHNYKEPETYILREVSIPLVYDNIVTGGNDNVKLDGVTFTLPAGQYNINQLISQLNITCSGFTFSYTYGSRVNVVKVGGGNFLFDAMNMNTTLGYINSPYAGAATYTSEYLYNLIVTKYFTLHSSFLSSKNKLKYYHSDNRSQLIAKIPINANQGQVLVYEPYNPIYIYLEGSNVDLIDFQLRDEYGDLVDLQTDEFIMEFVRK